MAKILIDKNRQLITPTLLLKRRNLETIGIIPNVSNVNLVVNFSSADEISFEVYKYINGELNPLWDEIESLKVVYLQEQDENFEISVNVVDNEGTTKNVTGTSLCEAELSNVFLYEVEINTQKDSDNEDYTKPSVFCNVNDKKHSIVHRILEKVPHYKIGHVDTSLASRVRNFSINGSSIYSFLTGEFSEQFGCICKFDSTTRTINFYDLENRCLNPNCTSTSRRIGTALFCPYCGSKDIAYGYGKDTSIFVTNENIAQEISMESETGSLKNCFRVSGGDDNMTAAFININPNGSQYIYYFNDSQLNDMPETLREKLHSYQDMYHEYFNTHKYSFDRDDSYDNWSKINWYNQVYNGYYDYLKNYKDLETIGYIGTDSIYGYGNLTKALYNASYLRNVVQTTYHDDRYISSTKKNQTTSTEVINYLSTILTYSTYNTIGISNSSRVILSTLNNTIIEYIKIFVDTGKFKISIDKEDSVYPQFQNNKWLGKIICENRTNSDDKVTSNVISLNLSDDAETFFKLKLQLQLSEYEVKVQSISDLEYAIPYLSLDDLQGRRLTYEGMLSTLSTPVQSIAEDIRKKYYQKFQSAINKIDQYIKKRNDELTKIDELYEVLYNYKIQTNDKLDFEKYVGKELLNDFYAYRREQEYKNSNFVSDGSDNDEIINNALQLFDDARRNLIQAATLQHTISVNMNDLLTIPEFEPIWGDFEVGNWIRVRVNDEIIRLRLIKYNINFEDVSSLSVDFSDVINSLSSTSDIQSILSKASSIGGKFDYVENQTNAMYRNKYYLDNWLANGLDASLIKIVNNINNQNTVFDANGILCREYLPTEDTYDDKQMKIINQGIYLTDDGWQTLKTAIGKFIYQDKDGNQNESYGVNAETLVGRLIIGENLEINNNSNNMSINEDGLQISNSISQIILNPNAKLGNIFQVLKNGVPQLSIDQNGNIKFDGSIINSATIGSGTTIEGATISSATIDPNSVYANTSDGKIVFAKYVESEVLNSEELDTNVANIVTANIDNAIIKSAAIKDLVVKYITADNLVAKMASMTAADVKSLTGDTAFIKQIASSVSITSDRITGLSAAIEDIVAKDVTADKIFGDTISTNKFKIKSDSGRFSIFENTLNIKDKNDKTRIQLGEDADGNFTFLLLDETGTGTILSSEGITEKAIGTGLIKSEKIANKSDGYNGITADKLDVDSITQQINKDGNLEIYADKIYYDKDKHSLVTVLQKMESSLLYEVNITSSNGISIQDETTLTANVVYNGTTTIVDEEKDKVVFTYQWYKNGEVINEATNKTYTASLGNDSAAQYSCMISYGFKN